MCAVGNILLAQLLIFSLLGFVCKKITFLHYPPPNSPFREVLSFSEVYSAFLVLNKCISSAIS